MILEVAFKLARENGYEQVVVKNIAAEMGCSVQPIYSYFSNMDALKQAVVGAAMQFYNGFIYSRVDNDRVPAKVLRNGRLPLCSLSCARDTIRARCLRKAPQDSFNEAVQRLSKQGS